MVSHVRIIKEHLSCGQYLLFVPVGLCSTQNMTVHAGSDIVRHPASVDSIADLYLMGLFLETVWLHVHPAQNQDGTIIMLHET